MQEFIHFIFKFTQLSLLYPHYVYISKRAKTVNITLKTQNKGTIQHLAIDFTGLKIYSESE
ncbi:Mobile element protein [Candidatus Enterovibrio altilux]|uniref:Mobile element protein n=1 Tax=Candidatus Enterovibrio altilux TaxID=1927128 RepID=A0A291B804_9GAMM|nr:Mobile element protein [Candidatus Enterovibrio luxaltus]